MKRIKNKIVMLLMAALLFTTTLSTIAWAKNIDTYCSDEYLIVEINRLFEYIKNN